jgi:hypothetical protein
MSKAMHAEATAVATSLGLNLSTWLRMKALEAAHAKGKRAAPQNDSAGDGPPIAIRFTAAQAADVVAAAERAKVSISEFIRRAAAK